ncbi:MAG: twin-arginine translocase subunit TatC [Longimicrobiales bacterium]|nr:twin-arginine translocase subunit TatC [Longimicrobiales bacterium]
MATATDRMARGEMPFLDHLEELRWRILWSALAVLVGAIVGFLLVHYLGVMQILIEPIQPMLGEGERLKYLSPADPFFLVLKLSVVLGVVLASPVVVYQVWAFLSPALEEHERKVIIPALYLGLVLFCAGVAMAYFVALPVTLRFLMGFLPEFLEQQIVAGPYLAFVTKLLIAFGVVFELPVVVMILTAMGLITPKFLREKRRHAVVGITVLASFLSPGDVITVTLLMMIPLVLLYEVSILLSVWIHRGRLKRIGMEPEDEKEPSNEPPSGAVETR